ncbi:MAG: hypothetical protein A7315_07475 [Candidatus Altiarchaeales archaeon WOR_SM1_79]|nr:MAG: hypothetical protein A7315_07475 [Candidatus Altiarchaeales archaeon WOR_SM1_79]
MKKVVDHKKMGGMFTLFFLLLASGSVSAYSSVGAGICNCGDGTTTLGGSATDACDDCEAALNDNTNCAIQVNYVGTVAISNYVGTCINSPANFNNKIFDCQGHMLDGDNIGVDFGIILDGKSGNTIKNCIITEFYEGIDLRSSSNDNNLINNIADNNGNHGIYIGHSGNNTLTGNTANNNQHNGLYITGSLTNTIESNTFCNNNQAGGIFWYDIVDLDATYGDDNTCDTTDNYNDTGTTGCTYSCSGLPVPEFGFIGIALAVLLTTPAFAYLLVGRRR